MTFSIHCAFPAVLQNDWVIFAKADNAADLSSSVSLRVHADGSVELRVREHKYRPDVRMRTAAGVVAQGRQHHFTVSLGYEGAWFTVDGQVVKQACSCETFAGTATHIEPIANPDCATDEAGMQWKNRSR